MNMAAVITACIFLLCSIIALVFMFVGKAPFCQDKYKGFYLGSCVVYISGVILVLIFTLIMKGLPVAYVLISDITITVVFCFTVGLIYFMTRSIVEAAEKAQKKENDDKREE